MLFEEFAAEQLRPLLGLATAISGDRGAAEDLVQDVIVKVARDWDRVCAARNPNAYVRRMLVNEHISWRRKWARILPSAHLGEPESDAPDFATRAADRDQLDRLLATLPPRQRVVLACRYYAELTDAEIAEALGCSPVTVRGYASRALSTLRAAITAEHLTERGELR